MARSPTARTLTAKILVGSTLLCLLAVLLFWTHIEKRFVFFPTAEISQTPAAVGLAYEEVFFTTGDGLRLHGWFVPGTGDVTWVWFHGNGGNIGHRVEELGRFRREMGINQFIFDYRGYGRSEGTPSEEGTYQDARAALAYLHSRPDVAAGKIVYFGRSLGAAVAVELAASHPPSGLVLVAAFSSMEDMAQLTFPCLPVRFLVKGHYDSLSRVRQVRSPLLVMHGDLDSTVPLSQGEKLFNAANAPKRFHLLTGAGHNDTYQVGQSYWEALAEFLGTLSVTGASNNSN
jgi:fermentation-respiration switch protein FrsA (DUF1100 family)